MICIEEQLRPRAEGRPWYRDDFQAVLLLMLGVLLLPAWVAQLLPPDMPPLLGEWIDVSREAAGLMASWLLPAAMGFLLAIRCGAIDLSVWAVMGLGGVVSAWLIRGGAAGEAIDIQAVLVATLAAAAAGAAVGAVNGLLVARLRLPSVLVTAAVALAVMGLLHVLCPRSAMTVPAEAFDEWVIWLDGTLGDADEKSLLVGPLLILRMLLVALAWSAALGVLVLADMRSAQSGHAVHQRWKLFASLCGCGALSAISGVCWLLDAGRAPMPTRLVDGLMIPTAVVLAGGTMLAGRGRAMLAGIFLPGAMLLAAVWRQLLSPALPDGGSLSLLVLAGAVGLCQLAFLWGLYRNRWGRLAGWASCISAVAGLGMLAYAARLDVVRQKQMLSAGLAACGAGGAVLVLSFISAIRRKTISADAP